MIINFPIFYNPISSNIYIISPCVDRVVDNEEAAWTRYNPRTGEHDIVRATRFHTPNPDKAPSTACMGIRVNIWNRAKVRRLITHSLAGGGDHQLGHDALDLDYIKRGDAGGTLGCYAVLSSLSEKVAKYLLEFHDSDYTRLGLPEIPKGSSSGDIHKMLDPNEVITRYHNPIF